MRVHGFARVRVYVFVCGWWRRLFGGSEVRCRHSSDMVSRRRTYQLHFALKELCSISQKPASYNATSATPALIFRYRKRRSIIGRVSENTTPVSIRDPRQQFPARRKQLQAMVKHCKRGNQVTQKAKKNRRSIRKSTLFAIAQCVLNIKLLNQKSHF